MKKIKTIKGSSLIIKYTVISISLTAISVLLCCTAASYLCLKFDIDISILKYASVLICAVTSAVTGCTCVRGFKNNGFALGSISTIPLIIYCFINLIFHSSGGVLFLIKITICIVIGGLCGAYSLRKTKRIKVK